MYNRNEGETERQYIWRLHHFVKQGQMTWQDLADNVNREFRDDPSEYRTSCAYRKAVQAAEAYYNEVFSAMKDDEYQSELQEDIRRVQMEKQKLRDERTEYNRLIRTEARKESYLELVQRVISETTVPYKYEPVEQDIECGENSLLIHLTDIHTGIEINSFFNRFDETVLIERLNRYRDKICKVRKMHNAGKAYIVIGEIVSGLIHNNLRLQNNLDLIEQFKLVSELIASMLVDLSSHFDEIYVYTTPGNHSRLSPRKEDALDGENLDILLPFYLRAKLQNYENIAICENTFEREIAVFQIGSKWIMAAHGHKDTPQNVVQNFTLMFKVQPDIVLLGHRHTNSLTTVFDTKVVQSGCVSGSDEYAIGVRKCNKPEQTISVIDKNGLVCIYDVAL